MSRRFSCHRACLMLNAGGTDVETTHAQPHDIAIRALCKLLSKMSSRLAVISSVPYVAKTNLATQPQFLLRILRQPHTKRQQKIHTISQTCGGYQPTSSPNQNLSKYPVARKKDPHFLNSPAHSPPSPSPPLQDRHRHSKTLQLDTASPSSPPTAAAPTY